MQYEQISAPWRLGYILGKDSQPADQASELPPGADPTCFLCQSAAPGDDRKRSVIQRSEHSLVLLNRYPYNNGHLLVAPRAHIGRLDQLDAASQLELTQTISQMIVLLEKVVQPQGFNVGLKPGPGGWSGGARPPALAYRSPLAGRYQLHAGDGRNSRHPPVARCPLGSPNTSVDLHPGTWSRPLTPLPPWHFSFSVPRDTYWRVRIGRRASHAGAPIAGRNWWCHNRRRSSLGTGWVRRRWASLPCRNFVPRPAADIPLRPAGEFVLPTFQPPPGVSHPASPPAYQAPPTMAPPPSLDAMPPAGSLLPAAPGPFTPPISLLAPQAPMRPQLPPQPAAPARVPVSPRAAFELPPAQPISFGAARGWLGCSSCLARSRSILSRRRPRRRRNQCRRRSRAGSNCPSIRGAKEDLPFELPDDTRSPLSFEPRPPEPVPFEPPPAGPPP